MNFGSFMMNPWTMFGASMLPGIIGSLVPHDDPRKLRQQALSFFDPRNLDNDTNAIFRQTLGGAGYNQARSELISGAQAGQGALNRSLAQTGLNRSGIGGAISAAAGAAPGFAMSRLSAAAWENAMQMARQNAQSKAQVMMGMPMSQGKGLPLFAGGINAMLPMLLAMLQNNPSLRYDMGAGTQYGGNVG